MWIPYFSIHFPPTPAGAHAGLVAYQRLRELSMLRQLSPPADLITATQEDIDREKDKAGSAADQYRLSLENKLKLPKLGQLLPQKLRAKKLMDQKAASVADVAFVLKLANESESPESRFKLIGERALRRHLKKTRRARRRMNIIREEELKKEEQLQARASLVERVNNNEGQLPLDSHTMHQLSMEYHGIIHKYGQVQDLHDISTAQQSTAQWLRSNAQPETPHRGLNLSQRILIGRTLEEEGKDKEVEVAHGVSQETPAEASSEGETDPEQRNDESGEVRILWADMRDGAYAESWPSTVFHGLLEPIAISKRQALVTTQHGAMDEEGVWIEKQKRKTHVIAGKSVHVIGGSLGGGWMIDRVEDEKDQARRKAVREIEAERTTAHMIRLKIRQLKTEIAGADETQDNTDKVRDTSAWLQQLGEQYPEIKEQEDRRDEWPQICKEHGRLKDTINAQQQTVDTLEKNLAASVRQLRQKERDIPAGMSDPQVMEKYGLQKQLVEVDAAREKLAQDQESLSVFESEYPVLVEVEARKAERRRVMLERAEEIIRLQTESQKDESQLAELIRLQQEDEKALNEVDADAADAYAMEGEPPSVIDGSTGADDVQALKDQGIEVDEQRQGLFQRFFRFFGLGR